MQKSKDYHHGCLRTALIDEAMSAVEMVGHRELSLSAITKKIGVTQPSIYNHFTTRDDLLSSVAIRGFRLFVSAINAVPRLPGTKPISETAYAYCEFNRVHPRLYNLLFARQRTATDALSADFFVAERAAHDVLLASLAIDAARPDFMMDAKCLWAFLHGALTLKMEKLLEEEDGADFIKRHLAQVEMAYKKYHGSKPRLRVGQDDLGPARDGADENDRDRKSQTTVDSAA